MVVWFSFLKKWRTDGIQFLQGAKKQKGENMDKYTKFILTVIAVGIIGINFQLFGGDIISKAEASHQTIR